jgi:hypothetical protein
MVLREGRNLQKFWVYYQLGKQKPLYKQLNQKEISFCRRIVIYEKMLFL